MGCDIGDWLLKIVEKLYENTWTLSWSLTELLSFFNQVTDHVFVFRAAIFKK